LRGETRVARSTGAAAIIMRRLLNTRVCEARDTGCSSLDEGRNVRYVHRENEAAVTRRERAHARSRDGGAANGPADCDPHVRDADGGESAGIPAWVSTDDAGGVYPSFDLSDGARLMIRESDQEVAESVLATTD
jgi:hypothetical protein